MPKRNDTYPMSIEVSNGQITFSWHRAMIGKDGKGSGHEDGLQIQLYWPYIKIKNYKKNDGKTFSSWFDNYKEFYFGAQTNFRVVYSNVYWGIGGNILGFGLGVSYQNMDKP